MGRTLHELIDEGLLLEEEIFEICKQIDNSIDIYSRIGLCHGNLTCDNIKIVNLNEIYVYKVEEMVISCKYLAIPWNFNEMFVIKDSILDSLVDDKYKIEYDSMGRYDYNTFYLLLLYLLMDINKYVNLKEYLLTTILLPINTINSKYNFKLNEIFNTKGLKGLYPETKIPKVSNIICSQKNPNRFNLNLKNIPKSITRALELSKFDKTIISYSDVVHDTQHPHMGFNYQINNLHQLSMVEIYEEGEEGEEDTGDIEEEIREIYTQINRLLSDIENDINAVETSKNSNLVDEMKIKNNEILKDSTAKNSKHLDILKTLYRQMRGAYESSRMDIKKRNTKLVMMKYAIELYIIRKDIRVESIQTFNFFSICYIKLLNMISKWNLIFNSGEKSSVAVTEEYLLSLLDNDHSRHRTKCSTLRGERRSKPKVSRGFADEGLIPRESPARYVERGSFDTDFYNSLNRLDASIRTFKIFQREYTNLEQYEHLNGILHVKSLLEKCDILYNQNIIKESDSLYQIILKKIRLLYKKIILSPEHVLNTDDETNLIKMNNEIKEREKHIDDIYHMELTIELKKELDNVDAIIGKSDKIGGNEKMTKIEIIHDLFNELSKVNINPQFFIKNMGEYKNYQNMLKELSFLENELSDRTETINNLVTSISKSTQNIKYDYNENNNYIKTTQFKINKLQDDILEFVLSYDNNPVITNMRIDNSLHPPPATLLEETSFEYMDMAVHKILENVDKLSGSGSDKRIYRLITKIKLDISAYQKIWADTENPFSKDKISNIIIDKFNEFVDNINNIDKLSPNVSTESNSSNYLLNGIIVAPIGAYIGKKLYDKIASPTIINMSGKIGEILSLLSNNKTYYNMLPTMALKYNSNILSKYYVDNNNDILVKNKLICDTYGLAL